MSISPPTNETTEVITENETNCIVNRTPEFSTDMVFNSREDLVDWVKNMGRSLGYVIVIKRSKAMFEIILRCDRGGIYQSKKVSTKNTCSKKTNCPFELYGKYLKKNDCWTLRVVSDIHNHEPATHMEGHPYAMRLSDEETRLVEDLTKKDMKPIDILSALKEQNKDNVSSLKTIYNARQKYLRKLKEASIPSENTVCESDVHNSNDNNVDLPTEEEHNKRSCSNTSKFVRVDVLENCEPTRHSSYYIDQLPNMFRQYITQVQDVKSDGNCGFRAIAVCLGLHEEAWSTIRSDLMEELNKHKTEYDEIFGRECRLKLHDSLNFFRSDIAASLEHWMTFPDMGILIASKYNVILHCLSVEDSMTYLPLWSTSPAWYQHVAIAIGHVNDNHYVKLTLHGGYPMPPVVPQWNHYRHECASAWISPYISRLDMYIRYYNASRNFNNITKNT